MSQRPHTMPSPALSPVSAPARPAVPVLPGFMPGPAWVFFRLDQSRGSPYSRSEYFRKAGWRLVQATVFRFVRASVRVRLLNMFGARIDPTANIRGTVKIHHPWLLRMGRFSSLGDGVHVYNLGPVVIGEHTSVSQNVHLCAGSHDWKNPAMPLLRSSIIIGSGTWICADAFIGPEARVGHNCVVAARSVVVGEVADSSIVGGNPARLIKPRPMPDMPRDAG